MVSSRTIPDEIMVEILLKLPIKSILRCNTLSKHYYSLIHSQFFIRRHLDLVRLTNRLNDWLIVSPMRYCLCLFNRRQGCCFTKLECLSPLVGNFVIIGPTDGLYCVFDQENNALRGHGITLWNPATLEEYILPLIPVTANGFHRTTSLACGFGYDHNTNSYKIVTIYSSILNLDESMLLSIYIFNVSERAWRNYNEEHRDVFLWDIRNYDGVFLCGACHWIVSLVPLTASLSNPINKILAFDMSMESSRFISLPDVEVVFVSSIVTLNGCLALIDDMDGIFSFGVWVMAEYGVAESWSMIYRVSLPHGIVGRSLGIIGDRLYVREGEGWIVSYDLDSKDVERYGFQDITISSLLPYKESLVRIISA